MCNEDSPEVLCHDCIGYGSFCKACAITSHALNPCHRISLWSGSCFQKSDLGTLGLVIRLGHGGLKCPKAAELESTSFLEPDLAEKERCCRFTVVHTTGVFERLVSECKCEAPRFSLHDQLLQYGIAPITFKRPQTGFTFQVLDDHQLCFLETKISASGYFQVLRRRINNAFPERVPVSQDRPASLNAH